MRLLAILFVLWTYGLQISGSGRTYGPQDKAPLDSRTIFRGELCPICGSDNYTAYNVRDLDVLVIYHCNNHHRFAFEGGRSQYVRYADLTSTVVDLNTRYSLERIVPSPSPRRVPSNLIKHDYDESMLIGKCPVCNTDKFSSYVSSKDPEITIYICEGGHKWSYEWGHQTALVYE